MADTNEPVEPNLTTAWVAHTKHVVVNADGKPLLKLTKKKALHLMARLAEALAADTKD